MLLDIANRPRRRCQKEPQAALRIPFGVSLSTRDPVVLLQRNLQHPLNRQTGAIQNFLRQFNARSEAFDAVTDFFERIHLHIFALAATAVVAGHSHHVERRRADEFLAGTLLLHPMNDA